MTAAAKILVVEDNPSIRFLLEELLGGEGYAVVSAADGRAGLEAARRDRPDLVLLDVNLPVMDGTELIGALRAEFGRAVPVLVMTAAPDAGRWAREIAADGVIAKPFDLDRVLGAIAELVPRGG